MKIAIQFFGHLRTYRKCYRSIQRHLLSKYDCDVFMHTWSSLDHNTGTWHTYGKNSLSKASAWGREEELKKIFSLKGLKIEDQVFQDMGQIKHKSIFGLHCFMHTLSEVNRLRERYQQDHDVNYDYVICLRTDLFLKSDFDIESFLQPIAQSERDRSVFCAGSLVLGTLTNIYSYLCVDLIFFARPSILSDVLSKPEVYFNQIQSQAPLITGPCTVENYFARTFILNGYNFEIIRYTVGPSFHILRPLSLRKIFDRTLRVYANRKSTRLMFLLMIPHQLFFVRFNVFGYKIDISMGALEIVPP